MIHFFAGHPPTPPFAPEHLDPEENLLWWSLYLQEIGKISKEPYFLKKGC